MPIKSQGCAHTEEGGGVSTSKKTSLQSNSDREDSPPLSDDLPRILRKRLLPRGYPLPSKFAGGIRLVNTFELCFGKLDGYNEEHTSIKLLALSVCRSIVSLASFKGTIIEHTPPSMRTLTSASLIRSSEEDGSKILDKLKIKVRLPSGKLVIGTLWKYDSYYNIAVVNIKASPELREACIHNQVPANVKLSQSKLVAIGRAFESGELMATGGTLLHGTTKFDCQQLMASTCKITKAGIGGLIVGSDGKFMGMSFYYKDGAPFLPFSILQKCLKHFNKFGRVVQLSLGLRIGSLQAEKLHVREQVHDSFPNAHGIYVQMVSDKSPAADSGIKVGDVITKIDKLELFNAQEFHELILDKPKRILRHGEGMPFTVCVLRPNSNGREFPATINAVIDSNEQNSWLVPKTKWLYPDDIRDADKMPLVRKRFKPDYTFPPLDGMDLHTEDSDEE
ncbi:serine endoprotease DegS isoform X2 [Triticum aestivum]|uniref:serine endoprotease DegS isoform X2 n=1 Tax=Triticum aestivum TaxID=4565 RepID=UPI001D00642D|nr:serine endoprotease DegS-like isoform X2 [Triticum aestivum]